MPEMKVEDVLSILDLFDSAGIRVWVDGGWGVDALLEEQTRAHEDLDIALEHRHVPWLRSTFESLGWKDVPRDDTRDCNFVLGSGDLLLDVHSFTFDENQKLLFGVDYPFDSLTGRGVIGGREVECIEPAWMVKFHTGYRLDDNDWHDVRLLCERFGLEIPCEYEPWITAES